MRLRTRLAVTSLAVLVPLAAGLSWISDRGRFAAMTETVRRVQATRIDDGSDVCGPEVFTPPERRAGAPGARAGLPVEFLGYRADFTPLAPGAPPLTPTQREALSRGQEIAERYPTAEGAGVSVAIPAPVGARCAFVVARMRPRPGVRRDQWVALGLSLVSVLVATWIAAAPVLARLRRLTARVAQSAAGHYAEPVHLDGADEIADLACAFDAAGAEVRTHLLQVEARSEALRTFVANTTHDIAVPLSTLQAHLSTLEEAARAQPALDAPVREAMREAHYLGSLLRNLGAAARLDGARPPERHPVDLVALVDRVVARHGPSARAREVDLVHAVPEEAVLVDSDLTLIEQAVGNLVDNAIQYNRAGGHVAVVLDTPSDTTFSITVLDDGPGIAIGDRERLLAAHARSTEARTRRPEGLGLGLAIVMDTARLLELEVRFSHPETGGLRVELQGARPASTGGPLSA